MLVNKIGILLVVTILSFTLISESFAETILVEFDKFEYKTGEKLTLSGSISEYTMPVVAVSIYDPNGKILSANNLELDGEGNFSKTVSLDSPFYDIPGKYKVKINYMKIIQEEFFTITGEVYQSDSIIDEKTKPEIILLAAEKELYADGDTVKITGIVSIRESTTVLIGIYDPFGTPVGFYFGTIDKNLEFSTSFLVKGGVNFKVDGVYSIKAHYAESEAITTFEFYEDMSNKDEDKSKPTEDKSKPTEDKSKPTEDKSKPTEDKSKPTEDKPKQTEDKS
ncbi:MAG: tetratricopeptide repeat protein, partial [Thaumarchaeota archaeon]|nr:tetratricopeptide repeat protein [Nitrososphaerota archaeon]